MNDVEAVLSMYDDVVKFHQKFQLPPYKSLADMPGDLVRFRENFIVEEAAETWKALEQKNWPEALDGLIDLAYVALGTTYLMGAERPALYTNHQVVGIQSLLALSKGYTLSEDSTQFLIDLVYGCRMSAIVMGFHFDKGWRRVQEANMSKIRAKRDTVGKRGSTWDVVKPEGWRAPIMDDLV